MKREATRKCAAWLWNLTKGYRLRLALALAAEASLSVMLALLAICSRELVDAAFGRQFSGLVRYGAFVLALTLGRVLFSTASRALCNLSTERIQLSLQRKLILHMLRADERAAGEYHSGVLMNRLTDDVQATAGNVLNLPVTLVSALADLACGAAVFYMLDAWLLALVVASGIALFLGSRLMRPVIQKRYETMRDSAENMHAGYQEILENRVVVKSFRGHAAVSAWLAALNERYFSKWRSYFHIHLSSRTVFGSFYNLGYFFVLLACAYRLYQGEVTFGAMTALLQLIQQLMTPFTSVSSLLPMLYSALSSAKRLMELEALPQEQAGNALAPADCQFHSIEAENLCFAYGDREILKNVSFSIPKGAFVLISGESGAGKSTLIRLLLGLYPARRLFLNTGAGSIAVGCETRGLFAYVPQGNLLLSGTLRENLTFFTGPRPDEALYEALRLCCAEGFVRDALANGLDTKIGEKAAGLSEGQAQRLSVARALLSDAPILLLDEATSALDPETEETLLHNLKALPGRTILLVSHKPAARALADMELRFDKNGAAPRYKGGTQSL